MRRKIARINAWIMPVVSALIAPTAARACYYHWVMGLDEPTGIWPTAPSDTSSAVAQLQAQDASDDAAVTNATNTSLTPAALTPSAQTTDPAIINWMINTNGAVGSSTDSTVNYVVSQIQANVQTVAYTSTNVYIKATGIPSHTLGSYGSDPAIPSNVARTVDIPRTPVVNNGTKTATGLGTIGVAVNGAAIYNAWDAMTYQNDGVWQQNANVFEASTFDGGPGHPSPIMGKTVTTPTGKAPAGNYHYHEAPTALINQLDPGNTGQHASPVIGFAFDGFPIFGPYGYVVDGNGQIVDDAGGKPEIQLMSSSYQLRNITTRTTLPDGSTASATGPAVSATYPLGSYLQDYSFVSGSGTLDQYNGRFAVAPGYPQGTYGYYVTETAAGAPTYPYIVGPSYYGVVQSDDIGSGTITVPNTVTYYTPVASWTNSGGNHSWNTSGNWSPTGVLSSAGAVANFNSTGAGSVLLNGSQTVGKININSSVSYTISQGSSGTLVIDDSPDAVVNPQINISSGNHTISAPIALAGGVNVNFLNSAGLTISNAISGTGPITVNGSGTLTIATTGTLPSTSGLSITTAGKVSLAAGAAPSTPIVQTVASLGFDATAGSKLDIQNNEMIITNTSVATIAGYITSGNIVSSLTDANHGVGSVASGSGAEIRYTLFGDTNLDGTVNFSDLLNLAQNYNTTATTWANGDFGYDGTTNFVDLLALAQNYNVSLTPGEAGISPAFVSDWNLAISEVAAVPEPASCMLLAIGAGSLMLRRRR